MGKSCGLGSLPGVGSPKPHIIPLNVYPWPAVNGGQCFGQWWIRSLALLSPTEVQVELQELTPPVMTLVVFLWEPCVTIGMNVVQSSLICLEWLMQTVRAATKQCDQFWWLYIHLYVCVCVCVYIYVCVFIWLFVDERCHSADLLPLGTVFKMLPSSVSMEANAYNRNSCEPRNPRAKWLLFARQINNEHSKIYGMQSPEYNIAFITE